MVRLLLNSEDASYDSTTKKYSFVLDRRLDKPEKVRIVKAHYTAATTGSYPLVVYLRSDALSSLIKSKHTLRLKNENHEQTENIIATLSETHAIARYDLQNDNRTFDADPHRHLTNIDIFWTNNAVLLSGGSNGVGGGGGSSGSVTDATIAAMALTIWIDLAPARTLTAAFAQCSALGDLPKHLYSRLPTPAGLILTGNWDFELVNMKTGLLGLSRDTDPSSGHGQALNDSSYPTSTWEQEFMVHHIWRSGSNYSQTSGLFKLNNYNCYVWPSGNGAINFRNSTGQNVALANINWIPNRVYITSIKRVYNVSTSTYEFHWEHLDVEVDTTQTEVTDAGAAVVIGTQVGWSLGISGMYMRHVAGPLLGVNSIAQTDYDNCIQYLKDWYGVEAEEEEASASQNASWFVELEIDQKQ